MTKVEWTQRPGTKGETWNPIKARDKATGKLGWFCEHASPGCVNCYAEAMNAWRGNGAKFRPQDRDKVDIFLDEEVLAKPLHWRAPRTIFVASMTDLFGKWLADAVIDKVFAVAALCPQHTFIVLTKRSGRMRRYVTGLGEDLERANFAAASLIRDYDKVETVDWPLRNVWAGVSIEDRRRGAERSWDLVNTPAALRFWSVEPLLEDLGDATGLGAVDWVICGGESGRYARPMQPDWARSIRDRCQAAGVPFFFKQWGAWAPHAGGGHDFVGKAGAGNHLDGRQHLEFPVAP